MKKRSKKDLNKQQLRNKPKKRHKIWDWRMILVVSIFVTYLGTNILSTYKTVIPTTGEIGYNELMTAISDGEVEEISVVKNESSGIVYMKDGTTYDIVNPQSDTFIEDLMKQGANISIAKQTVQDAIVSVIILLPMTLVMAFFVAYLLRTIIGANTKMFTLLKKNDNDTTFNDIRGISETKNEVEFIIKGINKWKELGEAGARPVKGILFYGPPGTGKTLLAKAIANEAGVPFISASGSDFNEMFVGTGARRIRDLWDLATSNAPCVIFIDEIDCIGKRIHGGDGTSMENNQTINALLQRMDGLNKTPGVVVIGATNRKESIDKALLRSGRFDRELYVGPPVSKADRDSVVELYLENKKLAEDVTLDKASKLLVGLTAADIDEALSEAVYISIMNDRNGVINLNDIDEAAMKIHLSGVKKEHSSIRDIEVTARHEAGHTIVSLALGLPVLKVSIQAYSSGAGGITVRDTDETGDIKLKLKSERENEIKVLLGGKCAEDIFYGEHTQGCGNDLEKATEMVYSLVTSTGTADNLLMNQNVLLESGIIKQLSPEVLCICNKRLQDLNTSTLQILKEHREELNKLSKMLIKQKTIVAPTLEQIRRFKENDI